MVCFQPFKGTFNRCATLLVWFDVKSDLKPRKHCREFFRDSENFRVVADDDFYINCLGETSDKGMVMRRRDCYTTIELSCIIHTTAGPF